jgi:hypothetical protein
MELLAKCFWCGAPHLASYPLSVCPPCVAMYRGRRFPMGQLDMNGSYELEDGVIDAVVRRSAPGNYALGYLEDGTFVVFYVGRSDSDVGRRLHEWVGAPSRYGRYASTAHAAWGVHQRAAFPVDAPELGRVGANVQSSYTRFAFSYARSPAAAFEKECRNYDEFGGSAILDNAGPPASALA